VSINRDQIIEQALKHELRAAGPIEGTCLEAETFAAWMDGGLDPAGVAAAEAHCSSCPRCRAMLAAFAHSAPEALGTRQAVGTSSGWWKWWLAPLAATAAAVVVWVVAAPPIGDRGVRVADRELPKAAPESQVAESQAKAAVPAAPASEPPAVPAPATRVDAARTSPSAEQPMTLADASRDRAEPAVAREVGAIASSERRETKNEADTTGQRAGFAAAAPAAPAAFAAPASTLRKQVAGLEVTSPDAARRWRVTEGSVERSTDGGATWSAVFPLGGNRVTTGTSPSPTVCWLVGPAGVVLLSTDGTTFTRLRFPEAIDLLTVSATDGLSAAVTAVDGRVFRTTDSGQTWR
jgi:hypothetical protein